MGLWLRSEPIPAPALRVPWSAQPIPATLTPAGNGAHSRYDDTHQVSRHAAVTPRFLEWVSLLLNPLEIYDAPH
jgi:hypothetical protein